MQGQETSDAIDVSRLLRGEPCALAAESLRILLLGCRDSDQATHCRITSQVCAQDVGDRFYVDSVGLDPAAATRNQKTGRIENDRVDAVLQQKPGQPKAIKARFEADL